MKRATNAATLPFVTEAAFQRHVIDQARSLGWGVTLSARKAMLAEAAQYGVEAPPLDGLIYHPHYSLGSEPGWPDLTLVRRRDRRLIFAELKSEKGVLSARQAEVLELLRCLTVPPCQCDALEVAGRSGRGMPQTMTNRDDQGADHWSDCPVVKVTWGWKARIEVFLWRPADIDTIARTLR